MTTSGSDHALTAQAVELVVRPYSVKAAHVGSEDLYTALQLR